MNPAFYYYTQGEWQAGIEWILQDYIPYGIIYILIGIMVAGTSWKKNKSVAITGFVFTMFLGFVQSLLPVEVQAYFAVLIAVFLFMIIYRVLR